jgi:hypothetical protein
LVELTKINENLALQDKKPFLELAELVLTKWASLLGLSQFAVYFLLVLLSFLAFFCFPQQFDGTKKTIKMF